MNVLGGVSIGFLGYTMFVVLDTIIKKYLKSIDIVFKKIQVINKTKIKFPLKGPIKHSTLKRITFYVFKILYFGLKLC